MHPFARALQCLKHPVTIASITLLIVNDHILKAIAPSWVTGKLSDFAGLFFFPFLLAAALSPITRRAGTLAFVITAVWFTLVKTSAWGIALTQDMLYPILGYRVAIVLDPTDLIALIVLFPAWRLWNQPTTLQPDVASVHLSGFSPSVKRLDGERLRDAWLILSVASLAALATSPAGYSRVVRVIAENQGIYARIVYESMSYKEMRTVFSQDGGRTWQETRNVPSELAQDVTLPRVVCESAKLEVCYRIAHKEQVEESRDGGKTWRVAWSIPAGRREYMERVRGSGWKWLAIRPMDLGPYDLALVGSPGTNDLSTLIVAMGDQGVLVRTPEGAWNRYDVWATTPIPFAAPLDVTSLVLVPLHLFGEVIMCIIAGVFALFFVLLTRVLANKFIGRTSANVTLRGIALAVAVVPAAFTPFALWAFGVIAEYDTARVWALFIIVGLTLLGVVQALWRLRAR